MSTEDRIKSVLCDQICEYRALLDLLRKERESLIHFSTEEVEALSKEKDTVVLKLRLLEEERRRLMAKLSAENSIPADISLQGLSEMTDDETYQRQRMQLISLLQGISELNEFNRILIERSSSVVKNALTFLGAFGVNQSFINAGKNAGTTVSREA